MTDVVPAANGNGHTDLDRVMLTGDLSTITPKERIDYYLGVCRSVGLNPLTRPFDYIRLKGKTVLYAKRDCADQLRMKHGVSIEIVDRKIDNGLLTIHVRASMPDGRKDEDVGVLPWAENLQGDDAANQLMKAITKAKRRVTLSICGLGLLDESEVTTVPGAEFIEIDDNGEIRGVTPVDAPPKRRKGFEPGSNRKTSYAAKKDGTEKVFADLQKALAAADDAVSAGEFWKANNKAIFELPSRWFDIIKEDYLSKMEDFGLEVEVGEQQ